jgi:hypothetical protein
MKIKLIFIHFFTFIFIVSCGNSDSSQEDFVSQNLPKLSLQTTWYWQLIVDESHPLRKDIPAELYDIDLFDISKKEIETLKSEGKIVICYFK